MRDTSKQRPDASIAGSGKLAGGVYGKVRIAGSGSVDGDLEAGEVSISGSGNLGGSVKAEKLSTAGSCSIRGDVEVRVIKSSGSIKVEGGIVARSIKVFGSHRVGGSVRAEEVKVAGIIKVEGDVEAERFEASGAFHVSGLINADQVEIELDGIGSSARDIGGSEIEVTSRRSFSRLFHRRGRLEVESIEGDNIYLEATNAQVVRGKRVRIGDGCRIDTVEYTESLEVSPNATVSSRVKTGDSSSIQAN